MKKGFIVLFIIFLVFSFAGCSTPSEDEQSEGQAADTVFNEISGSINIEVEGSDITTLTTEDFKSMEMVEKDLVLKMKHGGEENLALKGVPAKTIVDQLTDAYTLVKFVASDGYENEYDATIIDAEDSIFAVYSSGQELTVEEGLVWFAAGSQMGNQWMKNVSKIIIVNE
ncbi:MAG: hypothetical protein ACOWWR_05625 [Eubacteriales bacterium]